VSQVHNLLLHKIKTSPILTFLVGHNSIRLVPASSETIASNHTKEVVVCIHLKEDLAPPLVEEFLGFLAERPELNRGGYVKLLDGHKTESTMILAILPVHLASILSYRLDVSMLYLIDGQK
jgi:hypothetical protein